MDAKEGVAEGIAGGATRDESAPESAPGALNRTLVQTRAVIKTGEIATTSKDLDEVRREVDRLLFGFGGVLAGDQTSHDDDGKIESSTLILRVPVSKFDAAMDALEKLGRMKSSDSRSKDVTTEVIDVNERVETTQDSLDRLQEFLRTSQNIDDLIRFEREITTREAQLQSLTAQQAYLSDDRDVDRGRRRHPLDGRDCPARCPDLAPGPGDPPSRHPRSHPGRPPHRAIRGGLSQRSGAVQPLFSIALKSSWCSTCELRKKLGNPALEVRHEIHTIREARPTHPTGAWAQGDAVGRRRNNGRGLARHRRVVRHRRCRDCRRLADPAPSRLGVRGRRARRQVPAPRPLRVAARWRGRRPRPG